jgi:hypothetical protein
LTRAPGRGYGPAGMSSSRTDSGARVLAILGITVCAAGCGSSGKSTSHATPAAPATEQVAPKLVGTYQRTVTGADLARTAAKRHEGPGQSPPPTGQYRLVIDAETLTVTDPGGVRIREDLTASGRGDFTPGPYRSADVFCQKSGPGGYSWTVSGRALTLRALRDRCADRDSILSGSWKKA